MKTRKWRAGTIILGILAAIAVVVSALWGVTGLVNSDSASAGAGTVAFDPETDLVPDGARCTTTDFVNHSIREVKAGNPEFRQFGLAVSIPFKGETDEDVTKEIVNEMCGNPTFLKMMADEMMLWNVEGAQFNKEVWLQSILATINEDGLHSFVRKTQDGKLVVTAEFQKYAGWLNTVLLTRFNEEGKQSLTSERNWELLATSGVTSLPVAVQASVQENKPAWVRTLKDKMDNCLLRIGFNAEDRRVEVFSCVVTPPAEPPVSPPSNPECQVDCGGTPPPPPPPPGVDPCPWNHNLPKDDPGCLQPKDPDKDVEPPTGWTPLPVEPTGPQPPAPPPVIPLDPEVPPGTEAPPVVVAPEATPDPVHTPPPSNEGGTGNGTDTGGW